MNYKNKIIENRKLKELILKPYRLRGINTKNTIEHETVKFQIAYILSKQGYEVFLESPIKGGGRPDIIAINGPHGFIIEVLHSESEERYYEKLNKYPEEFVMKKVRTKDFDISNFKL